jgi:hypothetical protein
VGCSPGRLGSKMVMSQGQGGVGLPAHLGGGILGGLPFLSRSGRPSFAAATAGPAGTAAISRGRFLLVRDRSTEGGLPAKTRC